MCVNAANKMSLFHWNKSIYSTQVNSIKMDNGLPKKCSEHNKKLFGNLRNTLTTEHRTQLHQRGVNDAQTSFDDHFSGLFTNNSLNTSL